MAVFLSEITIGEMGIDTSIAMKIIETVIIVIGTVVIVMMIISAARLCESV